MPLFLDIHRNMDGVTTASTRDGHIADLEVQEAYWAKYRKYWAVTPENASEISRLPELLHEEDRAVFGDAGCLKRRFRRTAHKPDIHWAVALHPEPKRSSRRGRKRHNRQMPSIRGRVEHIFRTMEHQFYYTTVRYRGLANHLTQVYALVGPTNL